MKLKYEFTVREIMGEYALVPMGESALRLNGMIITNAVGALLCEKLREEAETDELVQAVLDEFEIDEETAKHDVGEFISYLRSAQLLTE
ncbi:MAG: PqqD family protein [Ruminococcaceae bacterium]|nr:PqqD family protein [Oscillospiraceae bacterium]